MHIHFFCPFGHRLKVLEERAGKKGRCPICRQRFVVPQFTLPETRPPHKGPWASQEPDVVIGPKSTPPETNARPQSPAVGAIEPPHLEAPLEVVVPPEPQSAMEAPARIPAPSLAGTEVETVNAPVFATESGRPAVLSAPVSLAPPPLPSTPARSASNHNITLAPPDRASGGPPRRPVWATWARGADRESYHVARATPRQLEMVYWLACLLPFAAVFTAAPAVPHIQFTGAPFWAQALLGIACLQLVYAAWLATVPDFSGVRVGACLLAGVTVIELLAAVALPFLPDSLLSFAGLSGARATASAWCGMAAVVNGLACTSCRWFERRWRRGQF